MIDAVVKEKQKAYADSHHHTRHHNLRPGDLVVTKLPKRNKFSLPYDPVPYKVVDTKGSMVSVEKLTSDKAPHTKQFAFRENRYSLRQYNKSYTRYKHEHTRTPTMQTASQVLLGHTCFTDFLAPPFDLQK